MIFSSAGGTLLHGYVLHGYADDVENVMPMDQLGHGCSGLFVVM